MANRKMPALVPMRAVLLTLMPFSLVTFLLGNQKKITRSTLGERKLLLHAISLRKGSVFLEAMRSFASAHIA